MSTNKDKRSNLVELIFSSQTQSDFRLSKEWKLIIDEVLMGYYFIGDKITLMYK